MFERISGTPGLALINETADLWRRIIDATPPDDPSRRFYLSYLGGALWSRAERTGAIPDLDSAIEIIQSLLTATAHDDPNSAGYLSNLGVALQVRYRLSGNMADLDKAIETTRVAIKAASNDSQGRPAYLSNLANALRVRFGVTSAGTDLDEAVEAARAAMAATSDEDTRQSGYLANLGAVLLTRFERTGTRTDLDEAVKIIRAAIDATPAEHPGRAVTMSNLGAAFRDRFALTGAQADLDAAISAFHQAVTATPVHHPARAGRQSNLASAQLDRFKRTGNQADLEDAIRLLRAAVAATPDSRPRRSLAQTNLGNALKNRFELTGSQSDLDDAIDTLQAAVQATPEDNPDRAVMLSNLGSALWARFGQTGRKADLDDAIETTQAAASITPEDYPARGVIVANLGAAFRTRFERAGGAADQQAALSCFTQVADLVTTTPTLRIQAAREAAALCSNAEPHQAADLLEMAIGLLGEVAPRHLRRGDQQYAIALLAGLASDAAAMAIREPGVASRARAERALRLLESGRAVLLSQSLATRDDLSDLREHNPDLAAQFEELRDRLDQDVDPPALTVPTGTDIAAWTGRTMEDRRRLADDLAATLALIRVLEGFSTFGLPPTTAELLAEAASGPVVTFNVSEPRSHALLLTRDGIAALELPGLRHDTVIARIHSFHQALNAATSPEMSSRARRDAQGVLSGVLEWLWDSAAEPVLCALGYHAPPTPGTEWPRVWWAPGGLLGLLPIQAAGYHTQPSTGTARRTVMDRVVSSYTPTVRALRYAREQATGVAAPGRAMIVAMPVTPGISGRLHHVPAEASMLSCRLPGAVILAEPGTVGGDTLPLPAGIPTKATVLAHLPGCQIAHFACHGASDPADPSNSLLLLQDHDTDPFTVASLSAIKLGRAELAYLSACRTAFASTTDLLDEAIHLTSAFQLAGFRHVIGTLWEIDDAVAVTIADTFYSGLRSSRGTLDTSRAACALHQAVRAIRDDIPATPSHWAAYLHAGA
jgi:tetratricopeptide (TPR) repeat protein